MNGRDLFFAAMKGIAEKVPFDPLLMHFTAALSKIPYSSSYCEEAHVMAQSQIRAARFLGLNHVHVCSDAYREANAWGVQVDLSAHTPMAKTGGYINYLEFDNIETPDLLTNSRIRTRIEAIKLLKQEAPDLCVMGWIEAPFAEICSLFDMISVMRHFFLKENYAMVDNVLKRVVKVQYEFAQLQIEAGADIIGAGDAAISQIGPKNYERISLSITKHLFSQIKRHVPVLYHTCGDNSGQDHQGRNMTQFLVETGANILDIDYQMNLEQIINKYGDKVCIRGNTNTSILGDPSYPLDKLVKQITKEILIGKQARQYIYAAGCEWPWFPLDLAIRNLSTAKTIVEMAGKK